MDDTLESPRCDDGIKLLRSLVMEVDAPLHELDTSLADEERNKEGPPRLDRKRDTDSVGSTTEEFCPEIL